MTMEKKIIFKVVQTLNSKILRSLSTLKHSFAEKEVRFSLLSLVLTTLSTKIVAFSYGCIGYDMLMLVRAWRNGQLWTWQSAISVLSIMLTVAGLLLSKSSIAPQLGVASVILDDIMLIYTITQWHQMRKQNNS